MLLDSKSVLVNQIRFTLTYDSDVTKSVLVKTNDILTCDYKDINKKSTITGRVAKIGCNFNSSLGRTGNAAYMQIDGSGEYAGLVKYIRPDQVIDIDIISTNADEIINVVCSVDNENQRITLLRENEVGALQYSLDGLTWKDVTGGQGLSAYEVAVEFGFEGTEKEWLESLKGYGAQTVAVQDEEPEQEEVKVWIKPTHNPEPNVVPFIDDASLSEENTWSSSKINQMILSAVNADDSRGARIYFGTAITGGTATDGTVFPESGLDVCIVGDVYINKNTRTIYNCVVGGNASVAKWSYVMSI